MLECFSEGKRERRAGATPWVISRPSAEARTWKSLEPLQKQQSTAYAQEATQTQCVLETWSLPRTWRDPAEPAHCTRRKVRRGTNRQDPPHSCAGPRLHRDNRPVSGCRAHTRVGFEMTAATSRRSRTAVGSEGIKWTQEARSHSPGGVMCMCVVEESKHFNDQILLTSGYVAENTYPVTSRSAHVQTAFDHRVSFNP